MMKKYSFAKYGQCVFFNQIEDKLEGIRHGLVLIFAR